MKGLLIKDFYMAKKHCFMLFIIFLLFLIMSAATEASLYFSYYSVALISMIPINIIAYDEMYKWNKCEVLLPVVRTISVLEKYIFLLVFLLPVAIIYGIIALFSFNFNLTDTIGYMSFLLLCGIIAPSVVLPIAFKIGYLKAKMLITVLIVIMVGTVTTINIRTIWGGGFAYQAFTPQNNSLVFAVIAIALLGISMLLSIWFYKKREF